MAAKKAAKKPSKKAVRRKQTARKRLTPAARKRGLESADIVLGVETPELAPLAKEVEKAGGSVIGAYREPLSGAPLLIAALPIKAVAPTPFQRDLSPTHTKRLAQKIDESGAFLDPLIVVRGKSGKLWTPNGRHRLAAAKVLGLRMITALISPDARLAYKILALNTEKAHNLKDRSLEVIRMAKALARERKQTKEAEFSAEFEQPSFLTLGLIYEKNARFSGGAYHPMLRKVDRFSSKPLMTSLRERVGMASRLIGIDNQVKRIVEQLQKRGMKSPYLKNYVVARINPVRFHRAKKGETKPPMTLAAALTRMAAAAKKFDVDSVNPRELALVAAVSGGSD